MLERVLTTWSCSSIPYRQSTRVIVPYNNIVPAISRGQRAKFKPRIKPGMTKNNPGNCGYIYYRMHATTLPGNIILESYASRASTSEIRQEPQEHCALRRERYPRSRRANRQRCARTDADRYRPGSGDRRSHSPSCPRDSRSCR